MQNLSERLSNNNGFSSYNQERDQQIEPNAYKITANYTVYNPFSNELITNSSPANLRREIPSPIKYSNDSNLSNQYTTTVFLDPRFNLNSQKPISNSNEPSFAQENGQQRLSNFPNDRTSIESLPHEEITARYYAISKEYDFQVSKNVEMIREIEALREQLKRIPQAVSIMDEKIRKEFEDKIRFLNSENQSLLQKNQLAVEASKKIVDQSRFLSDRISTLEYQVKTLQSERDDLKTDLDNTINELNKIRSTQDTELTSLVADAKKVEKQLIGEAIAKAELKEKEAIFYKDKVGKLESENKALREKEKIELESAIDSRLRTELEKQLKLIKLKYEEKRIEYENRLQAEYALKYENRLQPEDGLKYEKKTEIEVFEDKVGDEVVETKVEVVKSGAVTPKTTEKENKLITDLKIQVAQYKLKLEALNVEILSNREEIKLLRSQQQSLQSLLSKVKEYEITIASFKSEREYHKKLQAQTVDYEVKIQELTGLLRLASNSKEIEALRARLKQLEQENANSRENDKFAIENAKKQYYEQGKRESELKYDAKLRKYEEIIRRFEEKLNKPTIVEEKFERFTKPAVKEEIIIQNKGNFGEDVLLIEEDVKYQPQKTNVVIEQIEKPRPSNSKVIIEEKIEKPRPSNSKVIIEERDVSPSKGKGTGTTKYF